MDSTCATSLLSASTSRKASAFSASGRTSFQVLPPSVVRQTPPSSPVTQATLASDGVEAAQALLGVREVDTFPAQARSGGRTGRAGRGGGPEETKDEVEYDGGGRPEE